MRYVLGLISGIAALIALAVQIMAWFGFTPMMTSARPLLSAFALGFFMHGTTYSLLRPHTTGRWDLSLNELEPFLPAAAYKALSVSFGIAALIFVVGWVLAVFKIVENGSVIVSVMFSAILFSLFYTYSTVLLLAKLPESGCP